MRSIGIDLGPWVEQGRLSFQNTRPSLYGLEMHLVAMHRSVDEFQPDIVVLDPISNLVTAATNIEVKSMLSRLFDYLKMRQITAFCTDLTITGGSLERTEVGVSSLMDTWLLLQSLESNGERNRRLYLHKSRGMAHSNQVREFMLTDQGVQLRDVYLGPGGVLTGADRLAQEARDAAEVLELQQDLERRQRDIERKRTLLAAQIATLNAQFEAEKEDLDNIIARERHRTDMRVANTELQAKARQADSMPAPPAPGDPT